MNKPIDSAYLLRQLKAFYNNIVKVFVNDKLESYSLAAEAGYELGLSIDSNTYVMTLELKNKAGTAISTKTIDFPIESMVVDASYANGTLTLTLQSGSTVDVDISSIVGGLVSDSFTIAGIDMKDNITAAELQTALGVPTESTVEGWGFTKNVGDYNKPEGGIPKTDLASDVQSSLSKADSALQSYTEQYTGTYNKPESGIPKFDLAEDVQTSLGKADTALQSYTEQYTGTYSKPTGGIPASDLAAGVIPTTLPASDVKAWAKAENKPSYTAAEVGAIANTVTHLSGDIATSEKGVANGVATLDANGLVPSSQLPSYVDDVVEGASLSAFPTTGESGKIYVALDTNKTYRWSGSTYVEISESLALGTTSSTAAAGDHTHSQYLVESDVSAMLPTESTVAGWGFTKNTGNNGVIPVNPTDTSNINIWIES